MNVQQINKLISGKDTVTMIDNKKQDLITNKKHHTVKWFRHEESFKIKISEFLRWHFERKVLSPK
ncbi:MAG: hypothetical protein J6583_10065 [Gilliamella sp.]|nr:hypothetical protein [Gilliamella sp.]